MGGGFIRITRGHGLSGDPEFIGARRDLTGVVDPTTVTQLSVHGPGVDSLAGLEAMSSLQSLRLDRLTMPELTPLRDLPQLIDLQLGELHVPPGRVLLREIADLVPQLTHLSLSGLQGPVDYALLDEMGRLELLSVDVAAASAADGLARVDFGRLQELRQLFLTAETEPPVAIDLSWIERLPSLEILEVWGFAVDAEALGRLKTPPGLECMQIVDPRDEPDPESDEEETGELMDAGEFWSLIERSRDAHGDEHDAQVRALEDLLSGRSREDVAAFERQYRAQLQRASQWEVWGAGYLLAGGMGDSSFDYFCDFLIGCGREIFDRAVDDPDSLVDVPEVANQGGWGNELLRYAVFEAHLNQYGENMRASTTGGAITGQEWDDDGDDLAKLLPRLWAREGWDEE